MKLKTLLEGLKQKKLRLAGNPVISGLAYDSHRVQKGTLFIALPGAKTDGHLYADEAIKQGAVAIAHSRQLPAYRDGVSYIEIENPRAFLSSASAVFFNHPSNRLEMIGVTGTDGKSTTVGFIHQLLELSGVKAGLLSTVYIKSGREIERNPLRQSTPEAPEIHRVLADMVAAGYRCAVVEATSHGLSRKTGRLRDVAFNVGVLTNVSHEHLEFHGSFERYRSDKANLFRQLKGGGSAVLNRDDPSYLYFSSVTRGFVYTYSLESEEADLRSGPIESIDWGSRFFINWRDGKVNCSLPAPGRFNVANLLAATLTVSRCLKIEPGELARHYPLLRLPYGRFKVLSRGQPFRVVVDFAHTPESFRELFSLVKPLTEGNLIAVFGSAGERDTAKRPLQGEIASEFADLIILTDEDPRGEDPMTILEDIAAGIRRQVRGSSLLLEPDRREAMRRAFQAAEKGDTVLLLGKGHEQSIQYADRTMSWNEETVAEDILSEKYRMEG